MFGLRRRQTPPQVPITRAVVIARQQQAAERLGKLASQYAIKTYNYSGVLPEDGFTYNTKPSKDTQLFASMNYYDDDNQPGTEALQNQLDQLVLPYVKSFHVRHVRFVRTIYTDCRDWYLQIQVHLDPAQLG